MKPLSAMGLLGFVALQAGCWFSGGYYGARVRVATPNVRVVAPTVRVTTPTIRVAAPVVVPTGVMVVQPTCTQGAAEQCNGIDDNCNGIIDEGCGYQTGNIQVTAAWNGPSDIDLHVVDPMGEEVFYGHRNSASGGVLDRDANAACAVAPPTVENVYWNGQPPPGTYRVRLVAYDMCRSAATPVTLSIAVGGRIVGTYQFTFTQAREQIELPFTL